jgi:hypothetical protein
MNDIATRKQKLETHKQILHTLAASHVQSRQYFASTLQEQLLELKNENAIKKYEYLRDMSLISAILQHYAWPDPVS